MLKLRTTAASVALALLSVTSVAQGQQIVSAVGGVINSGGPGFGTLTETFDQSGLSANYVSGVTNFAAFLAGGPTHTPLFAGFEWFSNVGISSASVTYDLGSVLNIKSLALWNEESSGIGLLDLFASVDGVNFAALALGLVPNDNPRTDYGADVFSFATTSLQYVRFDMDRCPQPNPGTQQSCAIGEVAFETGAGSVVPEPGTYALMLAGLAGLGIVARRRRAA